MSVVRLGSSSSPSLQFGGAYSAPPVAPDRWESSAPLRRTSTPVSIVLPPSAAEPASVAAPLLDAVTVRGVTVSLQEAARLAPLVEFHPSETSYPCSAEHLLRGSELVDADGNAVAKNPTPTQLAEHRDPSYRLILDPATYAGEGHEHWRVRAPMYVSVQVPENGMYVDIHYVFLFAFQPAQTARVLVPGNDFDCTVPQFGEHEGDVEGITVRVSPDLQHIWGVRTEAHGHERWYNAEEVELERGHPKVRCSLNAHATYNAKGRGALDRVINQRIKVLGFGVEFNDILSDQGPRWQPFEEVDGAAVPNGQLVFVGLQNDGTPINHQDWTAFSGQIGRQRENTYSGAGGVDRPLSKVQRSYVNMIAKAAVKTGAVKAHYRQANGTPGFGGRAWMQMESEQSGS